MAKTISNSENALSAPLPWQAAQWTQLSRAFAAKQLAHAYLLSGCEGLGKSLFADDFARYVLCMRRIVQNAAGGLTDTAVACGSCNNCLKCGAGNHPDILTIEPEERSKNIKIDQIASVSDLS